MIEITLTGVNVELGKQGGVPVLVLSDRQSGIRVRVPLPGESARAVGNGLLSAVSGVAIPDGLREAGT